ncbi:MAG: TIGR02647 family protein [Porticoccaceae bacterium]|nr:TIGR02647 family protein [Porticoccaceae bacterium]
MPFSLDIQQELRVLALFNPASTLEGIKVHHSANQESIAATRRLYDKSLITQPDGGYLTSLGQEAVRHLDGFLTILSSTLEPTTGPPSATL